MALIGNMSMYGTFLDISLLEPIEEEHAGQVCLQPTSSFMCPSSNMQQVQYSLLVDSLYVGYLS